MRTVLVRYHHEVEGIWADSPDLDGYVAAGASLHEVRDLVREGLAVYLEGEDFEVREQGPGSEGTVVDLLVNDEGTSVNVTTASHGVATGWAEHLHATSPRVSLPAVDSPSSAFQQDDRLAMT